MMTEFEQKVQQFVKHKGLFSAPCRILLGLSGGADSMALLYVLHRWQGVDLSAVHVHHGLRGEEADRDAAFVTEQCAALGVPLTVHREDVASVARQGKIGLEEAGRRVRYAFYERMADESGFEHIATAHNADDQAETVLMNMVRGCGVDGLAGIPAIRGRIIRPLLCCTREEIEGFCNAMAIPYVTDSTNKDVDYTRNRCRHQLLPLLEQINPEVKKSLFRLSKHAANDSDYLHTMAAVALDNAYRNESYITKEFMNQPEPVRRRMLIQILRRHDLNDFTQQHISAMEGVVLSGQGSVDVPGGRVVVSQGRLAVLLPQENLAVSVPVELPLEAGNEIIVDWQGASYRLSIVNCEKAEIIKKVHKKFLQSTIACDTIHGSLFLRARQSGDYMHPAGRNVGKSLKKLMIEWHMPSFMREKFPLLCDQNGVLLVPGYACDERVRPHEKTKLFLVWQAVSETG